MVRQAKANSGKSLTIHAKTLADEEKIRAFKEIHARNSDLEIQRTVMANIEGFLAKHNWPPGNSQTLLEIFGAELSLMCVYCGKGGFKTLRRVNTPGGEMSVCPSCYENLKDRRLIRK